MFLLYSSVILQISAAKTTTASHEFSIDENCDDSHLSSIILSTLSTFVLADNNRWLCNTVSDSCHSGAARTQITQSKPAYHTSLFMRDFCMRCHIYKYQVDQLVECLLVYVRYLCRNRSFPFYMAADVSSHSRGIFDYVRRLTPHDSVEKCKKSPSKELRSNDSGIRFFDCHYEPSSRLSCDYTSSNSP